MESKLPSIGQINAGFRIVGIAPYPHTGDSYLFLVLCQNNERFVVWTYNSQDGGFYHGHYFDVPGEVIQNRVEAFRYFVGRQMDLYRSAFGTDIT